MMTSLPQPFTNTVPQGSNWLRRVVLSLDGQSSATISSGRDDELRIRGAVKMWGLQSPNMCSVRVYNPSPGTVKKFQNNEFRNISISAGYEYANNVGLIFKGEIKQVVAGHETPVDTYLEIFAADSQQGYESSRVGSSLAAGHTPQDKVNLAVKAMQAYGVTGLGVVNVDLSQPRAPRGAAYVGMARDLLRTVALQAGATWSIQNGKVDIVDQRKDMPGGSFKLTPATGLIGWPRQVAEGLEVTSLINPALQCHRNIEIDPSQIIQAQRDNNPLSDQKSNVFLDDQNISAGVYNIFHLDRFFDTRGQEFYDVSLSVGKGGTTYQNPYYTLTGS